MGISFRPNGMISAAQALRYWERRQEVVANNLANASTDGFKAERTFGRLIDDAMPAAETQTDLRQGALRPTGAPLDIALGGEGFLVVGAADGTERLTRGGAFGLDEQRRIVNADGLPLLGDGGPITVDAATAQDMEEAVRAGGAQGQALIQIDRSGELQVNGNVVGTLRVERVPAGSSLEHAGGGLFVPPDGRQPVASDERDIRQGFLEESNVTSVSALVEMITVQRAYANVQKAMTTLDSARGMAVSEIGKPV